MTETTNDIRPNAVNEKFASLLQVSNVQSTALIDIAELFFNAGINFALQDEPEKVCALLQTSNEERVNGIIDQVNLGLGAIAHVQDELEKTYNGLTQSELQYTSHVFRSILREFNEYQCVYKRAINDLWNASNPDDPATKENFDRMNLLRDNLKDITIRKNRMQKIQNKLKFLSKFPNVH